MIQNKWFKIEMGKDGSIFSCEEVAAKGRDGSVVRFYEAATAAEACSSAKAWHEHHKAVKSRINKVAREKAKAAGKCSNCLWRQTASKRSLCQYCMDRNLNRKKAVAQGAPRRILLTADQVKERVAERSRKYKRRRHFLTKMLSKLDELSPGEALAFRAWLVEKIESDKASS